MFQNISNKVIHHVIFRTFVCLFVLLFNYYYFFILKQFLVASFKAIWTPVLKVNSFKKACLPDSAPVLLEKRSYYTR